MVILMVLGRLLKARLQVLLQLLILTPPAAALSSNGNIHVQIPLADAKYTSAVPYDASESSFEDS